MTTNKDTLHAKINIAVEFNIGADLKKPEIIKSYRYEDLIKLSESYSRIESSIKEYLQDIIPRLNDGLINSLNELETAKEVLNKEIEARNVFREIFIKELI